MLPQKQTLHASRSTFRGRGGFTLIETLIVIAITTMLSGFAITYSRMSARQVALFIEEQKIAGLILRAKELAITAYIQPTASCGYGVRIDYVRSQYYIYSYAPPGAPGCSTVASNGISPGQANFFSDMNTLNSNLAFPAVLPTDAITYVLFLPPNPTTVLKTNNGAASSSVPGKVYLQTSDGSGKVFITVNLAGQVDF